MIPSVSAIQAAIAREAAAMKARGLDCGTGVWDVALDGLSADEIVAYTFRLVEDRLLPTDPVITRKAFVDRSVVVRRV